MVQYPALSLKEACDTVKVPIHSCFRGEESVGASFLRRDGTLQSTDQDGPIMNLLAEFTARTDKDRPEHFQTLAAEFGMPSLQRTQCIVRAHRLGVRP